MQKPYYYINILAMYEKVQCICRCEVNFQKILFKCILKTPFMQNSNILTTGKHHVLRKICNFPLNILKRLFSKKSDTCNSVKLIKRNSTTFPRLFFKYKIQATAKFSMPHMKRALTVAAAPGKSLMVPI